MRYHKKNILYISPFYILKSQQIFAESFDKLWNWRVFWAVCWVYNALQCLFFVPNWNYHYSFVRCRSFLSSTHRINVESSALSNIKQKFVKSRQIFLCLISRIFTSAEDGPYKTTRSSKLWKNMADIEVKTKG